MFVFGCPIGSEEKFARYAGPSIDAVREPDSLVVELRDQSSIFEAYNQVLELATEEPQLEGVVLLHEDLEIDDSAFLEKLRQTFADPEVWIAGAIGGHGVNAPTWWGCDGWVGQVLWDPAPLSRRPRRRSRMQPIAAKGTPRSADVDMLDGLLLVLSAEAARALRFDESLGPGFHQYDSDICLQARARAKRVRVEPLDVIHHTFSNLADPQSYARAHARMAHKWGL